MKIGFVTDSTCDLPLKYLKEHNIHTIPLKIFNGQKEIIDDRKVTSYQRTVNWLRRKDQVFSKPCDISFIKHYFIDLLTSHDYDQLICIMPMQSLSDSYNATLESALAARSDIRKGRLAKGFKPSVKIEIIDSSQISAGLGSLVLETAEHYKKTYSFEKTLKHIEQVKENTQTIIVPQSLEHFYNHNSERVDSVVGFGSYFLDSTLDIKPIVLISDNNISVIDRTRGYDSAINQVLSILIEHVQYGRISNNIINISYGNTKQELQNKIKYQEFEKIAKQFDVKVIISNMTATLNVNVGLGTFSVGFILNK